MTTRSKTLPRCSEAPLRALAVSHPAVAAPYRRKFELMARQPGLRLQLIVPEEWREGSQPHRCEPDPENEWIQPLPVYWKNYYARYLYKEGLCKHFARFQPDIVHLEEEPYSLCAAQTLWSLRRAAPNAKLIFRTSVGMKIRLKPYAAPLLRSVERLTYRRSAAAFALSRTAERFLRKNGFRGNVRVFPNGVDTRIFQPKRSPFRREMRIPEDDFLAGYVGQLVPEKGVDTLLRAAAQTNGVRALVVGSGPERANLQRLAKELKIKERVHFAGALASSRVAQAMNAMDALTLPSRTAPHWVEFFGRTLIEAMACGTPVIGSDSGEIPRVVGKAGMIFPEGDHAALSEALQRLQNCPELAEELRRRGVRRARNRFSWETIARGTVEAYRSVAAGAAGEIEAQ